jgi:uncharacterized protein (UPF0548 family)
MAELLVVGTIDPDAELARLRTRPLNFDPHKSAEYTAENGWHIDNYGSDLPPEPPGLPVKGGSWEIARELSVAYRFVDPKMVRAFFDQQESLEGRTLLLEVHFWNLRIYAGVRVGEVFDGLTTHEGQPVRVFAWNYQTLNGHFEKGRISYEVWKWLRSGRIEFRINAFSRRANPDNALVRFGFLLFGRKKQIEFARKACDRMAVLTGNLAGAGDDLVRPDRWIRRQSPDKIR